MKKKVVLMVRGGIVEAVKIPKNVKVLIRDYDCDTTDEPKSKDESGKEFVKRTFSRKDLVK